MSALFGAPKIPTPPPDPPAPPLPVSEDDASRAAKRRAQANSQRRRGLGSTLLSRSTAARPSAGGDSYSKTALG